MMRVPEFILMRKAQEMFDDEWMQLTGLDDDTHELIIQMHTAGILDMAISLLDGTQIVLFRLTED